MAARVSRPVQPFANLTLYEAICGEWQRSRQSYRPRRRPPVLFIICCHRPVQRRLEWQVGASHPEEEEKGLNATTWDISNLSCFELLLKYFVFWRYLPVMALLILWELLIQLSKLDFCWLQLQLFHFLSTTFSSIFFFFFFFFLFPEWWYLKVQAPDGWQFVKIGSSLNYKAPPHTRKSIESHSLRLNIVAFTPHSLCFSLLSVGKAVSLLSYFLAHFF